MSCIYLGKKEYWDHIDNAARNVAAPVKRAGEVGDGRLKALYALQAGMNARDIQKNQKTDKAINKNNAVGINISLGSTGWKDHAETITEETRGSRITAGKTAAVIAKEDMTVKGSTVNAKDIHLKTGNNIHILSSENKSTTTEETKGKSGSIGAFLSKGGYGIGASYGKGKGQIEETTLTHTPSDITAKNTVALSSGNDTLIRGGTVRGNKVTANAGRMSIESEQDKKNYKETSKTSGLSISYTPGSAVSVSGGKGKTNTDSIYESVTKQAGIYAGKEGYDIQVKNNTHLKGAVIDSKAPAEKNKLTTGTLTWENIDNKAEYKTKASGITVSTNAVSKLNPLGLGYVPTVPVKGKAGSITYAAIADSIITTTKEKTDKEIRHDTENALNKLSEIFDKKKIEEKQELVNLMSQTGFTLIGDIADRKESELKRKAEEARKNNNSMEAETYEKAAGKWSESGTNRIAMHGIMGALVSKEAGAGITKGLTGAGLNAALQGALKNISDPEVRKAASLAIGQAVAGETGSAIAEYATVFNWLSHQQQEMRDKLISEAEAEGDMDKAERIRAYYQELDEKQDDVIRKLELPESDDYSPSVEAAIIESTNIYEDTDAFREVTIGALKIAKEKGLTEYHFLDEDYVTLNASIGMGIGLSGGFIMDRTGNVYSVVGGGFTGGIGGTIATGKLAMDTSGWTAANLQQALSGGSVSFGLGIGGSVTVNVSKVAGSREIGGTTGISAGMTGTYTQFICNINDL